MALSEKFQIMNRSNQQFKTPVVFMVFNRPEKTRIVFNEIKRVQPERFFIIADGPRNEGDKPKCQAVREIIDAGIDWPCQVFRKYSDTNFGCKTNIASGIDWVFKNVEEAIFLEDDCVPDQSFFPFCAELLEKYRRQEKIMQICGYNMAVLDKKFKCQDSYYFSNIGIMLGWASWRRAWKYNDVNVSRWPEVKKSGLLKNTLKDDAIVNHYNHLFDDYYDQKVDSWDSPWFLARWLNGGLSVVSKNNLIKNIGFDAEAAHKSIDPNDPRGHIPVKAVEFPLVHPSKIAINSEADFFTFKYHLSINRFWGQRLRWFLKKRAPRLHKLLKTIKKRRGIIDK